jgi:hypothetical protein
MSAKVQAVTVADIRQVMAINAASTDPVAVYKAVDALAKRSIGHRLFTLMRLHRDVNEVERLYSDNTEAYPVGGRKQKQGTSWGRVVLDQGEVYIAKDEDDIRANFADHALILSLGIGSIMNIPIASRGHCLGTMNISNAAHWFTPAHVETGRVLAGLLLPAFLAA